MSHRSRITPFIQWLFFLSICLFMASACKTKTGIKISRSGTSTDSIVYKFLHPPEIDFFSGKAKLTVNDNGDTQKANMFVRNQKDSAVWLLLKKLSVEGGRFFLTPDSLYFINRLDKEYFKAPMDTLESLWGMTPDFSYFESHLWGIPPSVDIDPDSVYTSKNKKELRISMVIKGITYEYIYDRKSGLYTGGRIFENGRSPVQWTFGRYQVVQESFEIPFYRQYQFKANRNESIILTLDYSDIELNVPKAIRFDIPPDYNEIRN